MAGRRIRRALARITIAALALATPAVLAAPSASAVPGDSSTVFINEFHYDNTGADTGEFIEVAGPAGTNLTGWSIVLYNGANPAAAVPYTTISLTGVITDEQNGYGTLDFAAVGLQNGSNDGFALVNDTTLVQLLSYEGPFTASTGPAAGSTSTDVGVSQTGSEPVGSSLQLTGTGSTYGDFTWTKTDGATANTRGEPNTGQVFGGDPVDLPPITTCPATLFAPFDQGATAPVSATDDNDNIGAIAITSAAVDGITLEDVDLPTGSATLTVAPTTTPGSYDVTVQFATDAETPQTSTCTVAVTVQSPPVDALISDVQGSGSASPLAGQLVDVEGIVTSLFTANDVLDGFFLQEEETDWDDDPSTSEGVFVFCRGECPAEGGLAVGDQVGVRGLANEFFGMTQVSSNTTGGSLSVLSSGNSLPPATKIDLPADGSTEAEETFESVEGMVVEFTDTLVVSEYFELARYGQLVLTADERPYQFTHSNLPSVDGYSAFIEDLEKRRIILDDDNNTQNDATTGPENNEPYPWPQGGLSLDNRVRGGDTIENLTGVMHWSFAGQGGTDAWRIRPIQGLDYEFTSANPAPAEPEDVGGRLTVTSYNVLNYFATVAAANICGPLSNQDCRGADSEIERERQLTKIATALAEIDADVAGLIEIENDGDDASADQIVDALNGLTAPDTYAAIETGFIGTDAIKVALVYQPATVTPVGDYAILDGSVDPRFIDSANRPVLIQTFEENSTGERFTIAVNHLKSKGSACAGDPDLGDGQGNCNLTRTAAAEALSDYLATDPTGSGDSDFLIVGDLNAYAMEDPITTLEAAGWTDLHEEFEGPEGYSYVFDGQLGYLDTALANESLLPQVTGATAWHINADEVPLFDYNDEFVTGDEAPFERESSALPLYAPDPLRSSDHDPIIVGLSLGDPAEVVSDLRETLAEMDIQRGIKNALDVKLRSALTAMERGDTAEACDSLQSFIDQVKALEGKKITTEQVDILIGEAVVARVMLDC